MTNLLLEPAAIAMVRERIQPQVATRTDSGAPPGGAGNADCLSTACRDVSEQVEQAIEAAERLEKSWELLMENPVLRVAYQRYHGIYGAASSDNRWAGADGNEAARRIAAPGCHERVSDMLLTLRELRKLGPGQWNCIARDYARAPEHASARGRGASSAGTLQRLKARLAAWMSGRR